MSVTSVTPSVTPSPLIENRENLVHSAYKVKPSIFRSVTNHRWLLQQPSVNSSVLEDIRRKARETWNAPDIHATSYGNHYEAKTVDEPTLLRPTSPTRRNNPHPSNVFLSCRLHYVQGFGNPDATVGRPAYRVDGSAPGPDREKFRMKYNTRPATAAINQFGSRRQPEDRADSRCSDDQDNEFPPHEPRYFNDIAAPRPASLNRYLKVAGTNEIDGHRRMLNMRPKTAGLVVERSVPGLTFDGRYKSLFRPTRARGDFSIHPDWPPVLPHHNIP